MANIFLGYLLNILVFSLVGFGPVFRLLKPGCGLVVRVAMAPVAGVVLTTIAGSWLVICDFPVSIWAGPWAWGASIVSLIFGLPRFFAELKNANHRERRLALGAIAVTAIAAALLFAPQFLGGFKYSLLRGNGADTINYVAGAGFIDHETHSDLTQDPQILVDRHQSYLRARNLVGETRWATFMLLAFCSRVAGVPIYQFEFCFTLLFFVFAGGCAFAIALCTTRKILPSAVAAVAVSTGFWAQYVLDNRAVSHINSIPVMLGMVLVVGRVERSAGKTGWSEWTLLAFLGAGLFLLYPEITPMFGLGFVVFFLATLRRRTWWSMKTGGYLAAAGTSLILTSPVIVLLFKYLLGQIKTGSTMKVPDLWVRAGLNWLYSEPMLGVWGLAPLAKGAIGSSTWAECAAVFIYGLSVSLVLSLILVLRRFACSFSKGGRIELRLVTSVTIACLVQAGFLLFRHQYWAAGKAFSYGYPFVILAIAGLLLGPPPRPDKHWRPFFWRPLVWSVAVWLTVQCGLGLFRSTLAFTGKEFYNYIWHHGEYRRHDLDFSRLSAQVASEGPPVIWSYIPNITVSEYAGFALGWQTSMVSLLPTIDSSSGPVPSQRIAAAPRLILIERSVAAEPFWRPFLVVETPELALLRIESGPVSQPIVVGVQGALRVEAGGNIPVLWFGLKPVTVAVVSPASGYARLRGKFRLGSAARDSGYVPVMLRASGASAPHMLVVTEATRNLRVPLVQGANEISIQPSVALGELPTGSDLFGIDGLEVVFETTADKITPNGEMPDPFEVSNLDRFRWENSASPSKGQLISVIVLAGKVRLEVASSDYADICLVAPLRLGVGLYRVSIVVSGEVEGGATGAAHLSLHGKEKLITIPAGRYASTLFSTEFNVGAGGLDAHLSFGLGGWSLGRGRIVLESLRIEKMW